MQTLPTKGMFEQPFLSINAFLHILGIKKEVKTRGHKE